MVNTRAEQTDFLWLESEEEAATELAFLLDQAEGQSFAAELAAVVADISEERELSDAELALFDALDRAQEQSLVEDCSHKQEDDWANAQ
jgi:hypothetical protein